jgi:large conductance mechanosensitive channel
MLQEFKKFLLRGNVVDLAVGVVIGSAFTLIVNSIVADLLTPIIGAIIKVPDFAGLALTVNDSQIFYGKFINAFISFLLVASAIFFFVIKPMNILVAKSRKEKPIDPTTKKCKECLSEIPLDAKRCAFCTEKQ